MELEKIVEYYRKQGAPVDQSALVALLKEVQSELGGSLNKGTLAQIARSLSVKESFLEAVVKRIPSLRLSGGHILELCGGPNCGKHHKLTQFVTRELEKKPGLTVKYVPCMRLCGKGPNIRWDGKLYHGADEALLRKLMEEGK